MTEGARETPLTTSAQLRLALIELGRIEREIQQLAPHAREEDDRKMLASLRACRDALLRIAHARMNGQESRAS